MTRHIQSKYPTRTLHAINIENVAGEWHTSAEALRAAGAIYRRLVPIGPADQFVIGTDSNPQERLAVGLDWPGTRVVHGHGPDGTDRALLAAIDPEWVGAHFTSFAVGNGDSAFEEIAWRMRERGLIVTVASRRNSLSRLLARAAHIIRFLPAPAAVTGPPTITPAA